MTNAQSMREYETIYIMRPTLDDKAAQDLMLKNKSILEGLGGKSLKITAMGRKKLAWETQKETRGIFVHHRFLGAPGIVKDFDRALTINDQILTRHSVLLNNNVDPTLVKAEDDLLVAPLFKEKRDNDRGFDRSNDSDNHKFKSDNDFDDDSDDSDSDD